MMYDGGTAIAAYWMHWTVGHLSDPGANLDLVIGKWGDGASVNDRIAVALIHREMADGPSLMVVNAADRQTRNGTLASTALAREDVIGTPLAANIFALVDAIYLQDDRFF
jgi:hypothetical protein